MEFIRYEKHDAIAVLNINRPKALNALNRAVLKELTHFLEITVKQEKIRALILTGEGEKAFIAGADIKEMQSLTHMEALEFCRLGQKVTMLLEQGQFLTLAAVNGYALGGGLEMALACDFIYASKNAKLGLPEVTLGIIPGFGGTQRLSRAIGARRAKEMTLSGKPITAEEGYRMGLINKVTEQADLIEKAVETARGILQHSETAILQAKSAVNAGGYLNISDGLELERNMFAVTFATPEREKGMEVFLNKGK